MKSKKNILRINYVKICILANIVILAFCFIFYNSKATSTGTVYLQTNQTNNFDIANNNTENTNMVNTNLEILAIENVLLYPPFDTNVTKYDIEISNETSKLNILAVPENEKASVQITGNDDLYVVGEEYDGRKTLVINPQIEFNVVLAGILKQNKPQISEVEKILKNKPQNAGIWINEQSRDRFLKMINSETESEYYVDSNGYLRVSKTENQNEYDKVLYNSINGNNLFIIDISGFCYCLDEVTGEVVCYQFEDMDPYQAYEVYEFSNSIIYIITSNHSKVLSSEEIFSELIGSMRGEI